MVLLAMWVYVYALFKINSFPQALLDASVSCSYAKTW